MKIYIVYLHGYISRVFKDPDKAIRYYNECREDAETKDDVKIDLGEIES